METKPMGEAPQALKGVKVLDLSRVLAMPFCSMILGDLGADIVRVERPEGGDETRKWGPPWVGDQSAYYLGINRNKKSITVDLKKKEGQEIIHRLAKKRDIFLENYLPGTLSKMNLGYEQIRDMNPAIIYASLTGFGQDGPSRNLPGYDFIMQARGGLMSITGEADGPPIRSGVAVVDITGGLFACSAVLAALHYREKTGRGQYIDLALLDTQVCWLANQANNYLVSGKVPWRSGNAHPNMVPAETFMAKDGVYIALSVGNDPQWRNFCRVAEIESLTENPKFANNPKRVENHKELIPLIQEAILKKSSGEWHRLLTEAGIPNGPINTIDRVFQDPQVLSRGMVIEMNHPVIGKYRIVGSPLKFSETPVQYRKAPPLLGEDTEGILLDLGYDLKKIVKLREDRVI